MANVILVTCPSCRHERNLIHSLRVYDTMPLTVTDDESLITGVGICETTGEFIWRTADGWQRQVSGRDSVFLSNDEADKADEDA